MARKLSVAATAQKLATMKFDTSNYITLTSITKLSGKALATPLKAKKKLA